MSPKSVEFMAVKLEKVIVYGKEKEKPLTIKFEGLDGLA